MFEAGFYALLSDSPVVMGQVGGSPLARADGTTGVFPEQLPEEATLPALVYTVIGRQSVTSTSGTNRLAMKRVQIDCYARNYLGAKSLQEAVKEFLLPFMGELADGTVVNGALLQGELDAFEFAPFLYCAVLDFNIWIINV